MSVLSDQNHVPVGGDGNAIDPVRRTDAKKPVDAVWSSHRKGLDSKDRMGKLGFYRHRGARLTGGGLTCWRNLAAALRTL